MTIVRVTRLDWADKDVPLPVYQTSGAAGADVRANFPPDEKAGVLLLPRERALIPTGIAVEVPDGFEIQVRPRSGLALKKGLTLANAPGTIDSDYRGPLGVIMINLGQDEIKITHGMRIAQLVVAPVAQASFEEVSELQLSSRGDRGFGSTGTN